MALQEAAIAVSGMDCASCVAHVEKAARGVAGVTSAQVNLAAGRATVVLDPDRTDAAHVAQAITESGYVASPMTPGVAAANVEEARLQHQAQHARQWLRRAIVGLALWLPVEVIHWIHFALTGMAMHPAWFDWLTFGAGTVAIVYVGSGFYAGAWQALRRGTSNMDTLIAMGTTVAYGYSVTAMVGFVLGWWAQEPPLYFMEATGLLAIISTGHCLEARVRDAAGAAIRGLLNLAPARALRLDDRDQTQEVPAADLAVGDRVLVRPGERVPVDGVVLQGPGEVDESMITGEAMPVTRDAGDPVIGGTVNRSGRLIVRATQVGAQTALAQMVKLVETAQSSKPPVQKLADRISAVFVPAVLAVALATALGWYAWGHAHAWTGAHTWGALAKATCSVLIIACPCALGLALPAALMVGTGRGAGRGILIRDIDALQEAERIDTVVLDKTGTVTQGQPQVTQVVSLNGMPQQEILRLAAAAEQYSEHPLAKAIMKAAQGLDLPTPESFQNAAGFGVEARLDGRLVLVGNRALLARHGREVADDAPGGTLVHVAAADATGAMERLGVITISDAIKSDSASAVAAMHAMGLRTILLTGDNRAAAEAVAAQAGIGEVHAEVRPADKAAVIAGLQRQGHKVAMVGDGINDAPALAQADLGIAIGSASDIAKETGGVVLVGPSLHGVVTAIRLSRATMRKIRQNLFLAFVYNVAAIPLAALGMLNPLVAAAAMALSDVTVIGNALRLRRTHLD